MLVRQSEALEPLRHGVRPSLETLDLTTTKPGTPGGIFMRQFWHAIARSEDLQPGHATPIRIMSEDFSLYRGENGRAQVTAYRCPHRGALMHLGWVEGDDIRCVYHGWKFRCGDGQCVEAPAEKDGFGERVALRTYPTEEAYGLIYAYFGSGEAPQFPPYPDARGEGITDVWPAEVVPCNYLQCFENSMDEVHVNFTHAPGGSHGAYGELPLITAEEKDWGLLRYGKRANGLTRITLHFAPNIVRVVVPPLNGMKMDLGFAEWPEITYHFTPIDDEHNLWLITSKVRLTGPDAERFHAKKGEFLAALAVAPTSDEIVADLFAGKVRYADVAHPKLAIVQDIAVQAGQGAIEDRDAEVLGRSDAGIAAWRRILSRELNLIADGREPKKWCPPTPDVVPVLGIS